jgi:hypothetical protein
MVCYDLISGLVYRAHGWNDWHWLSCMIPTSEPLGEAGGHFLVAIFTLNKTDDAWIRIGQRGITSLIQVFEPVNNFGWLLYVDSSIVGYIFSRSS